MRRTTAVFLLLVGFAGLGLVNGFHTPNDVQAQQVPPAVKPLVLADGLIALSSDTADGFQQIAVIDSKTRVMSVYHVEHKSGTIALKSVRSLSADLEMDEFNTEQPLPRDIRAILNKR
jgi:hypothetical protein